MDEKNNQVVESPKVNTEFMSVNEMAKLLSIARATAYQLARTKDFPCFFIGKRIIIPMDLFSAWVEKQAINQSELLGVK